MAKQFVELLITFFTSIIHTKAPNDIELAIWVWMLIIGGIPVVIYLGIRQFKKIFR